MLKCFPFSGVEFFYFKCGSVQLSYSTLSEIDENANYLNKNKITNCSDEHTKQVINQTLTDDVAKL